MISFMFRTAMTGLLCLPIAMAQGQSNQDIQIPLSGKESDQIPFEILETKKVPREIEYQVSVALMFYPELQNVPIIFRFARQTPPLSSRPKIFHVLKKAGKRTYMVTISNNTKNRTTPILFKNLDFKAQIGVLGHELAHIAQYEMMTSTELLALPFKLLSTKYVDRFELGTDQSCIDHGLGAFLMQWSISVREKLEVDQWLGYRQTFAKKKKERRQKRYMDPEMIHNGMIICKEFQ